MDGRANELFGGTQAGSCIEKRWHIYHTCNEFILRHDRVKN